MKTQENEVLSEQETINYSEEKKQKKKNAFMKLHWQSKVIIILAVVLVVLVSVLVTISRQQNSGTLTTISESSLQKVLEISELSTVDYTYNAIATLTDGSKVKYYVAYEGTVTAGINFDNIKIDVDEVEKIITIKLPPIEIQSTRVNMGTLDFIFANDKYETESVSQEAYKLCTEDLEERIKYDAAIYSIAKDNAKSTIEALFEPWIDTIDHTYVVEVK